MYWIPLGPLIARDLPYSCGFTSVGRPLLDILQRKLAKTEFATALSSAGNDLVGFQIVSIRDKVLDIIVGGICGSGGDLLYYRLLDLCPSWLAKAVVG